MMIAGLKCFVNRLFTKHLLLTNVCTNGTFLALGDYFVQKIDQIYSRTDDDENRKNMKYDWPRTGRMLLVGLAFGPFNHFWYLVLDRVLVGTARRTILKKILADQCIAAPFFGSSFLFSAGLLEGKVLSECADEWKEKFITIYMADWCFWPPAQFVNFYFLPTKYRVAYVSALTLCWNAFLSFIKHKDLGHGTKDLEENVR